jgi:hypothetical protein
MRLNIIPIKLNAQPWSLRYRDMAVRIHAFEFVGEFGRIDGGFGRFDQGMEQTEFVVVGIPYRCDAMPMRQTPPMQFYVEPESLGSMGNFHNPGNPTVLVNA